MASAAPSLVVDTPADIQTNGIEASNLTNGHANGHPIVGTAPMTVKNAPVENFRPMKVVAIGAGFSGIYLSIRLPEWLRNVDFTVYEKNPDLGGTWLENRYPGCACDIPAHSYVYTFEPNPGWTSFYATAPEIHQYLSNVADKYSAKRFIKVNHKVTGCYWDEAKLKWKIDIERVDTGERFSDEADVIVSARGGLNEYLWPKIEGLKSFKGKTVHSATWDQNFDYSNKRIGVIGSGSSAIQIVPQLQKLEGTKIDCFIRSKTWIAMPFGAHAAEKLHLDHDKFTEEDHEKLMGDDAKYHNFRKTIETEGNAAHPFSLAGSEMSDQARQGFTHLMRSRLAKKPEYADLLIPSFAPGCRRLTPGPGFLEALTEDNVDFVSTEITSIEETGVRLADGKLIELDVLVCATGFNAAGAPPFPIVGKGGKTLKDRFDPYPEAYLSVATDGFPNFFSMLGPNSGVASGSLTKIIEATGDYILRCVRKLQKEDIGAMSVSPRIVRDWNRQTQAYFKRTVFMDKCKTWYRKDDKIIGLWPGSTLHAVETLRSPRWEDYEYTYRDDDDPEYNRMAWLGNGWSDLQLSGGDLSWYIEPENIDFPAAPLPEKTEKWVKLSFTY